jgi:Neprosin/Neprosin activation peptide
MEIVMQKYLSVVIGSSLLFGCATGTGMDGEEADPAVEDESLEVVRVVDERERERMREYVDHRVDPDTVVTSLELGDGTIVDCVDRDRQPALLRPGMEHHVVKLAPEDPVLVQALTAPMDLAEAPGEVEPVEMEYGTDGLLCPEGSIPLTRATMEQLVRFRTLEDYFQKVPSHIDPAPLTPVELGDDFEAPKFGPTWGHQHARADRIVDNYGMLGTFNLWNPYVQLSSEFSLAQIWVMGGLNGNGTLETVEAGWQDYPDKYGDWSPHLFIYFTPDAYGAGTWDGHTDGCYNLDCDAFVQVNNSVNLGGGFGGTSTLGGTQVGFDLEIVKAGHSGDWWVRWQGVWIGYYPRELFDNYGMRDEAEMVSIGGEIYNTQNNGKHTYTDMGSGRYPEAGWGWAAFISQMRYVDLTMTAQGASNMTEVVADADCYDVAYNDSPGYWSKHMYFGGPGYNGDCM